MGGRSAFGSRRHFWRIGLIVCGVAATIALMAAVPPATSAQTPCTPGANGSCANPGLTAGCGLKVAFVLDESLSIAQTSGATLATQRAAKAFVGALSGTGSELYVTAFSISARRGPFTAFTEVNNTAVNTFDSWIGSNGSAGATQGGSAGFNPAGPNTAGTNWEGGLLSAQGVTGGPPQLMVFVTDGAPNRNNAGQTGSTQVLTSARNAANTVKSNPTHIFVVGVGDATASSNISNIQAISGTSRFGTATGQNSDFKTSDYTLVTNFSGLEAQLRDVVTELCAGTLTINKRIVGQDGFLTPAAGWRFETMLSGGHTWKAPAVGTTGTATDPRASLTTGVQEPTDPGLARFEWTLSTGVSSVGVSVQHFEEPGFSFVSAQCTTETPNGPGAPEVSTAGIPGTTLGRRDFRVCTVINRQHTGILDVVKHVAPPGDTGVFNLFVGDTLRRANAGNGEGTGEITLPLGSHMIHETAGTHTNPADYGTPTWQCVDLNGSGDPVVDQGSGTPFSVTLTRQNQHIECTITNQNIAFGDLTVIKHVIPANDSGRFNLLVSGAATAEKPSARDGDRLSLTHTPFGTYHVTETAAAGTDLSHYDITTICTNEDNGGGEVATNPNRTDPSVSVVLSHTDNNVVCIIENKRTHFPVAHLTVVKHLVPSGDAGVFDLLIGGKVWAPGVSDHGSTGRLQFELGKHEVTEHAVYGTHLADFAVSTTCVNKAGHTVAHNAHGPSVTVDLASESDDIVCTITNKRTEAPEGGGQIPDTPGPLFAVEKRMPAHARVGEDVPFRIIVHNLGQGTATGVQLREIPPHGMRIVSVADHGTIEHNGTAVWHLGDLAPGESRTVRGTLRVTHTGLHVNSAVATARNSDPALSAPALRARAAAHRPPHRPKPPPPPPFTG